MSALPDTIRPLQRTVKAMMQTLHEERPWFAADNSMTELVRLLNNRRIADGEARGLWYLPQLSKLLREANPPFDKQLEILRAMGLDEVGIDPKHLELEPGEAYYAVQESLRTAPRDDWLVRNSPGMLAVDVSPHLWLISETESEGDTDDSVTEELPEYFGRRDAVISITVASEKPGYRAMLFREHGGRLFGLNEKFRVPNEPLEPSSASFALPLSEMSGSAGDFRLIALAQRAPFHDAYPRDDRHDHVIGRPKWAALMRIAGVRSDAARVLVVH